MFAQFNCVVYDVYDVQYMMYMIYIYLYKNYIALQLYGKHTLILDDRGRIFAQFKCVVSNYEWIV